MAVSFVRRKRTSDAAAFCARLERTGGRVGSRTTVGVAARAAPCLRQPPPAQWRGFAHRADAARPHRYLDHPDLHPRGRGATKEPGARPAPAGREVRVICLEAFFHANWGHFARKRQAALTSEACPPKQPSPVHYRHARVLSEYPLKH